MLFGVGCGKSRALEAATKSARDQRNVYLRHAWGFVLEQPLDSGLHGEVSLLDKLGDNFSVFVILGAWVRFGCGVFRSFQESFGAWLHG